MKKILSKIKNFLRILSYCRPITKYEYKTMCSLISLIVNRQHDNIGLLRNDLMAVNRMVAEIKSGSKSVDENKNVEEKTNKKNGRGMYQ